MRFLRRTEGVEAARKYFLDARKSPSCTYHVYVAYATMAFCLDKDPKVRTIPFLIFRPMYFRQVVQLFIRIQSLLILMILLYVCLEMFLVFGIVEYVYIHICMC